jgi:hypothetical protein
VSSPRNCDVATGEIPQETPWHISSTTISNAALSSTMAMDAPFSNTALSANALHDIVNSLQNNIQVNKI